MKGRVCESTRKPGAKILMRSDGGFPGMVGGGRVEKESVEVAPAALTEETPRMLDFVLTEENGFACSGSMSVYIDISDVSFA